MIKARAFFVPLTNSSQHSPYEKIYLPTIWEKRQKTNFEWMPGKAKNKYALWCKRHRRVNQEKCGLRRSKRTSNNTTGTDKYNSKRSVVLFILWMKVYPAVLLCPTVAFVWALLLQWMNFFFLRYHRVAARCYSSYFKLFSLVHDCHYCCCCYSYAVISIPHATSFIRFVLSFDAKRLYIRVWAGGWAAYSRCHQDLAVAAEISGGRSDSFYLRF